MDRRNFIIRFTQVSVAGLAVWGTPASLFAKPLVEVEFNGKLLKGASGQILSFSDKDMVWNVLINFGVSYHVQDLYQRHQSVYAKINYKGHHFILKSVDGVSWRN